MTPRPEIAGIAGTASVAELRVVVRDLLEVPESEAESRLVRDLMRPVLFVPETKPVVELIRDLQREMQQLAVVVDEYGGVAGLITMEDLAEEILGEINDADQVRRAEIVRETESAYLVRGGVSLEKLREMLGVALEVTEATTFAGVVHSWFGYVPKPGESLERDGLKVEVLEATPRRVVRLRVTPLVPAASAKKSRKRPRAR